MITYMPNSEPEKGWYRYKSKTDRFTQYNLPKGNKRNFVQDISVIGAIWAVAYSVWEIILCEYIF